MKKLILILVFILSAALLFSCGDDGSDIPEDGYTEGGGENSNSEYDLPYIGENGNWFIGDVDTGILAVGKNGVDGKDGKDGVNGTDGKDGANGIDGKDGVNGENGITPHIGDNGNWFIGDIDTGILAAGKNGADGKDGVDGAAGKDGTDGSDGITPHIGENGNWFIGDVDTGVLAEGRNGTDGKNGTDGANGKDGVSGKDGANGLTPYIGLNGNWFIGTEDTGIRAEGKDGTNGKDGASGANGTDGKNGADGITPQIGENGNWYVGTTDTGIKAIGKDGENGKNGTNGVSILKVEIVAGSLFVTYSDNPESPVDVGKINAEIAPEANLEFYPLPDGTLGVKAGKALYSETITIPESYGGVAVTEILPDAFKGAKYLKFVTIPDTVTKISSGAFTDCPSVVSIFIPKTVKYIESGAFKLAENSFICLEGGRSYAGYDENCFAEGIRVVENCATGIQYQDGIGFLISADGIATVVSYVGNSYKAIIPDTIAGNSVKYIADYAFKDNKRLLSITVPNSVIDIGKDAFSSNRLKEIYNLSEVLDVGSGFDMYKSLSDESKLVDTGDGFVFYGEELVDYYGESENAVLPINFQGRTYIIGSYAFSASAAKIVTAANGTLCNEIMSNALTDSNIESFAVPSSVKKIHEYAFSCERLVAIEFDVNSTWKVGDGDKEFKPTANAEENYAEIKDKIEGIFTRT